MAATATTRTPSSPCLALHEAERVGVRGQRPQTWRLAKAYWEDCQNADGSWGYNKPACAGTGSMTCAGITSLVIAADQVQSSRRPGRRRPHRVLPGPRRRATPTASNAASQWLGRHYSVDQQSRRQRPSGCSTISTAWSAPAGSPPGGSSPRPDSHPTGIAKGPTAWCASRTACRASGPARATPRTTR